MGKTMSGRQFNQDTSGAKRATAEGPVFITDRGEPSHVLLSMEDFRRLSGNDIDAANMLSMRSDDDIDFEPPRLVGRPRAADLD